MTTRHRPLIAAIAVALTLAACSGSPDATGDATTSESSSATTSTDGVVAPDTGSATAAESVSTDSAQEASTENAATHGDDTDYEWSESGERSIELRDAGSTSADSAVLVDGSVVTIAAAGTYRIGGTLSDGQLVVDAADQLVRLILDGVDITNPTGAAVAVMNAERVVVLLADGSVNTLADGADYTFVDADADIDEPNATLYSRADLTITGGGSLAVEGNYNDGIASKDGLIIAGGTVAVTAVDDGIRGKDYVVVNGGAITVTASGDGIKSDNDEDDTKGYIAINGGTLTLTTDGDAITAETDVLVASGSLTLTTAGGSGGMPADASAKGIKGLVSVVIDGGTIVADTADDAVHSNNSVTITGGDLTLATGDDGVHADADLHIYGGTILITESYEGLESAIITIDDGMIEIHSDDDGINVAGGVDGSGVESPPGRGGGGPGGGDQFSLNSDYQLLINGGTIVIHAQGDGLDSNGIAVMTGGTAIVHGPTANNNGAIDAGSFDIGGGLLVAVGSAGMAEGVDAGSSQAAIQALLGSTQAVGTVIHIEASDGNPVLTFEPTKEYASIVFSSPDLDAGTTYDIYLGGTADGVDTGGVYEAGAVTGGTLAGSLPAG